jgi:hypothetical protein
MIHFSQQIKKKQIPIELDSFIEILFTIYY